MHLMKLLHNTFKKELPSVHKIRLQNLLEAAGTLLKTRALSLTSLGRHLPSNIKVRSKIKKNG